MVILLDNGDVFVCGDNSHGQLNLDPKKYPKVEELMFHRYINDSYEVVDIGCGSHHTVFIAISKKVNTPIREILTCGYHGCLGVLDVNEDEHRLQHVKIPDLDDYDNIEFLICKFNSSAILDNENNLYYWGDDFDGFRERIPEKKNMFKERIVDISFGYKHALILLEDGSVYAWGDDTYGGCSSLINRADDSAPKKISHFSNNDIKIVKVEAGCRHSLFLDTYGKVYGFGLTKLKNHNTERIYSPIELEDISDLTDGLGCIDIFAGDTQSVAIDANGLPYKWEGVTGKCGIVSDVGGKNILEVAVGNQNIIILT